MITDERTAVVFHRVDLDGIMSMAIAVEAYAFAAGVIRRGGTYEQCKDTVTMVPYTYGDPVPDLSGYGRVVMVDVSLPWEDMITLRRETGRRNIIWVDHHATAIDAAREHGYDDLPGIRRVGTAACELTFEQFHPGARVPRSVRLLSLYDTWTKNGGCDWETVVLPFQWALREEYGRDAQRFLDHFVLSGRYTEGGCTDALISKGTSILSYARRSGEEGVGAYGFPVRIGPEGHPGICCLTNTFGGLAFGKALRDRPGAVAVCVNRVNPREGETEETYKVSVYAGDSKPAWHIGNYMRRYGGGGHDGAGGGSLSREQFMRLITEGRL